VKREIPCKMSPLSREPEGREWDSLDVIKVKGRRKVSGYEAFFPEKGTFLHQGFLSTLTIHFIGWAYPGLVPMSLPLPSQNPTHHWLPPLFQKTKPFPQSPKAG
jgi:hypothetical protein